MTVELDIGAAVDSVGSAAQSTGLGGIGGGTWQSTVALGCSVMTAPDTYWLSNRSDHNHLSSPRWLNGSGGETRKMDWGEARSLVEACLCPEQRAELAALVARRQQAVASPRAALSLVLYELGGMCREADGLRASLPDSWVEPDEWRLSGV